MVVRYPPDCEMEHDAAGHQIIRTPAHRLNGSTARIRGRRTERGFEPKCMCGYIFATFSYDTGNYACESCGRPVMGRNSEIIGVFLYDPTMPSPIADALGIPQQADAPVAPPPNGIAEVFVDYRDHEPGWGAGLFQRNAEAPQQRLVERLLDQWRPIARDGVGFVAREARLEPLGGVVPFEDVPAEDRPD